MKCSYFTWWTPLKADPSLPPAHNTTSRTGRRSKSKISSKSHELCSARGHYSGKRCQTCNANRREGVTCMFQICPRVKFPDHVFGLQCTLFPWLSNVATFSSLSTFRYMTPQHAFDVSLNDTTACFRRYKAIYFRNRELYPNGTKFRWRTVLELGLVKRQMFVSCNAESIKMTF
jgi:hypothetical protein